MLRTALFRLQVQGMSFIAAVLILNLEEADAFIAFANLLNKPCQMAFFRVDHELVLSLHTQHVIDAQIISIVLKDCRKHLFCFTDFKLPWPLHHIWQMKPNARLLLKCGLLLLFKKIYDSKKIACFALACHIFSRSMMHVTENCHKDTIPVFLWAGYNCSILWWFSDEWMIMKTFYT